MPMSGSSKKIYDGKVLTIHLEKATLPNGKEVDLEIIRHPGGAAALPVYDNGDVLMIRQFRHAAGGIIWEVPAGRIGEGEDPETCAFRELQEEAGVIAARMEKLGEFFPTPGFCTEVIHLYLATDLKGCQQRLEADEYLQVERLSFDDALAKVYNGEIMDSKTMLALLLAREKLTS